MIIVLGHNVSEKQRKQFNRRFFMFFCQHNNTTYDLLNLLGFFATFVLNNDLLRKSKEVYIEHH